VDDQKLLIVEIADSGDARGNSYSAPDDLFFEPFPVASMHVATIEPGALRGNHFHAQRRELLVIIATDHWSLHWDVGEGTPVERRQFDGPGAVLVAVPTGMAHAIRNDGAVALRMVGLTDGAYDPSNPDAYRRAVV
jgi:dTDP-4-dehydrorhamnose 3,5-epimerase-like enzyme